MSNLTDTIDQIIHENDLPFDWPEEVLNELDTVSYTHLTLPTNREV